MMLILSTNYKLLCLVIIDTKYLINTCINLDKNKKIKNDTADQTVVKRSGSIQSRKFSWPEFLIWFAFKIRSDQIEPCSTEVSVHFHLIINLFLIHYLLLFYIIAVVHILCDSKIFDCYN